MAASNPFPGMNPYLESRWGDVHTSLVTYARDALQDALPRSLRARSEERVFLEEEGAKLRSFYPDVALVAEYPRPDWLGGGAASAVLTEEVAEPIRLRSDHKRKERFIEIIDAETGGRVVTVIEFLSPTNKRPGPGRKLYQSKQNDCEEADINLVEIDLLRTGTPTTLAHQRMRKAGHEATYHVSVLRGGWELECYPIPLRERLPTIRIPLRPADPDITLPLQTLIDLAYSRGRHDDIDYTRPLDPPLAPADAAWASELVK